MPEKLEMFEMNMLSNSALQKLIIPSNVSKVIKSSFSLNCELEDIVWPVSLLDGTAFPAKQIESIEYQGTKAH